MPPKIQEHFKNKYFDFNHQIALHMLSSLDPLTITFGQVKEGQHDDPRHYQWDQDFKKFGYRIGHFFFYVVAPQERLGVGFFQLDRRTSVEGQNVLQKLGTLAGKIASQVGNKNPVDASDFIIPPHPVLSPRERDVMTRLAGGLLSYEIAQDLQLAEVTVKKHIRNARKRLGCATREQAVAVAIQNGLLGG